VRPVTGRAAAASGGYPFSRFAAISFAAFIASIAVVMLQSQQLGEIHSSAQQADVDCFMDCI